MIPFLTQSMIALGVGFLLDLVFGDPYFMPHPIRLIGKAIEVGEKLTRSCFNETPQGQMAAGTVLALCMMILSFGIPFGILWICTQVNALLSLAVQSFMCYQILAIKSLKTESTKVYAKLADNDLKGARYQVSMIVGRDTENLSMQQVAKATVETIAENTSDGTVAPLIFLAVGGAPLGFLYKSINTMDSMIGYKNDRYLYFGRFAAKLDDVANYIPARVSALIMILASLILGMDYKNAFHIFLRDRYNHASPNSAQTEAVCAGALRIQLAGDAYYFGKLYKKKSIGDAIRPIEYEDIARANRLLYGTAWISTVLCLLGMGVIQWLI
ncbi:MAG: adenosylcobinamide-phosphate synthase CbiB [Anaerovorax sp.]|nr:adenosylcobinamide-phosphate synthase CbiB [Anaerovorax sp.]